MSSSENHVEMESSGSEDSASTISTGAVSTESSGGVQSQRSRSLQNSQASETVVPETPPGSEVGSASQDDDDVFNDQSATNAILEELELMRPTYVFSEDTVRAEGRLFDSFLESSIDFSSSSESDEDSDSCISPPASRSFMRRSGLSSMDELLHYRSTMRVALLPDQLRELRPNMTPSHRRRRAPYVALVPGGIAYHSTSGPPHFFRI